MTYKAQRRRTLQPASMAERDREVPRTPLTVEDLTGDPSNVSPHTMAKMDQGRTSPSIRGMYRGVEVDEVREALGIPKERIQGWSRMSVADRVDAMATWLIFTDNLAQSATFRMRSDVLGSGALTGNSDSLYSREIPFSPETVDWIFTNLGHTSICWGASSPMAPFGANPQWRQQQWSQWHEKRSRAEGADHARATSAVQVRSIRKARA